MSQLTYRDWLGFIGLVFGMFMAVLDIQIVNSSLAQIQAGLSATSDEISWVQTSYLVAEIIMIPLSGWLGRALSTRYLFCLSAGGFTLMSLACASVSTLDEMIIARAFQGFFGGAMIPSVFAVVYIVFPRHMQPKLSIIIGLVVTMAPTLGPVLGGYLTEVISWHALFTINLIPGIFVCLITWFCVRIDEPDFSLFQKIDFPGIIFLTFWLGPLEFILEEGVRKQWFESELIVFWALVSGISFILLLHRELTCESPMVNFSAFKNKNFSFGCFFSFILGFGLFSGVYLLPLYLGIVKNLNSFQIGIYVMVMGLFQLLSAPLAAFLSKKFDLRLIFLGGFCLFGLGMLETAYHAYEDGYQEFFLGQAIRGLSLMLCFVPINTLSLGTLPHDQLKNASGLYNLMRNLGGAIGLAIINSYLTSWNKTAYGHLRTTVTDRNPAFSSLVGGLADRLSDYALPDPARAAFKMITDLAHREASIVTFNQIYVFISLIFFLSSICIFLVKRVEAPSAMTESH